MEKENVPGKGDGVNPTALAEHYRQNNSVWCRVSTHDLPKQPRRKADKLQRKTIEEMQGEQVRQLLARRYTNGGHK